jgi:hypothetical protein
MTADPCACARCGRRLAPPPVPSCVVRQLMILRGWRIKGLNRQTETVCPICHNIELSAAMNPPGKRDVKS